MRGPLLASQQWGGERSFADATANGKVAPESCRTQIGIEPLGSLISAVRRSMFL
jgi:hypothetical protein